MSLTFFSTPETIASSPATHPPRTVAGLINQPVHAAVSSAQVKLFPSSHYITASRYATSADQRGYIPVFEYPVGEHYIMIDSENRYVHFTSIWKALGHNKADIVKLIDSQPDIAPMVKRVRGGYLKIQGTWLPYEIALTLAKRVAFNLRHDLVPIFGPDFPNDCLAPGAPGFGRLLLSAPKSKSRGRPLGRKTKPTGDQAPAAPVPTAPFDQSLASQFGADRRLDHSSEHHLPYPSTVPRSAQEHSCNSFPLTNALSPEWSPPRHLPLHINHVGHARHYSNPAFKFGTAGRDTSQMFVDGLPASTARCLPLSVAHATAKMPPLMVKSALPLPTSQAYVAENGRQPNAAGFSSPTELFSSRPVSATRSSASNNLFAGPNGSNPASACGTSCLPTAVPALQQVLYAAIKDAQHSSPLALPPLPTFANQSTPTNPPASYQHGNSYQEVGLPRSVAKCFALGTHTVFDDSLLAAQLLTSASLVST